MGKRGTMRLSPAARTLLTGGILASALLVVLLAARAHDQPAAFADESGIVPGRYIVVLNEGLEAPREVPDIERAAGVQSDTVFTSAIEGFSAGLSRRQVNALLADPRINNVIPDRLVHVADTTPTGIERIDAEGSASAAGGDYSAVRVAVLDTGIDAAHADLNVDLTCSFSSQGPTSNDGHGHGTHVAGTIGAIAGNAFGVKGVAPGATVCPVKVLNDSGTATWAQIISGIDFVTATRLDGNAANDIHVVNMSLSGCANPVFIFCITQPPANNGTCGLSGTTVNDPLHKAICDSTAAGVIYAVAAGNDASRALYYVPGAYPEVVTVGALADYNGQGGGGASFTCSDRGPDDSFANFSNYNEAGDDVVDVTAPGACILSTWPGGGTNTISGTSMASPHVAGALAKLVGDGALSTGTSADPLAARNAAMSAITTKPMSDPSCGYAPGVGGVTGGPVLFVGQPDTSCGVPSTGTPTPTPGPSPTPTPVPTPTPAPTPTPEPTPTPTPTSVPTPTPVPVTADLKVNSAHVTSPTQATVGEPFVVTVAATVENDGPAGPVEAGVTWNLTVPSGCSKSPSGTQTTGGIVLAQNAPVSLTSPAWSVICTTTGSKSFLGRATVSPSTAGVSDPNSINDFKTAIGTTDIVAVTPTPTPTPTPPPEPTPTPVPTPTPTPTPPAGDSVLYFSLEVAGSVGGVSAANEDIVAFDGAGFSLFFDGSAHGLASFTIDGFAVLDDAILFSFTADGAIPGITGTVDESDVVRFDYATSAFTMFFDGSDVGLASTGEDVDAVELLPDGRLLVSVDNLFGVPGVTGNDEDIIAFTGTFGPNTSGTWQMYFDGADVGFNYADEDIDGLAVSDVAAYLSTIGNFSASGLSGANEDIAVCGALQTGGNTACGSMSMFFNGSDYGLSANDISAIDLP
jgi:subtilisin family serine protease